MSKFEDSIVRRAKIYYGMTGNGAGGILHIVLDDGNIKNSDIEFCIALAKEKSDYIALELCYDLLSLPNKSRRKIIIRYDEYAKHDGNNINLQNTHCKCENSTWNRDAGCFVCDDCGERI